MIKKFFCKLFGTCHHEWTPWEDEYRGSLFQHKHCKKCHKRKRRMV